MKILYVTTVSGTINAFLIPHIHMLLDQGYSVDIACNVQREIDISLINRDCKVFDIELQRSPLKKENYLAYKKLKSIVQNYDIVHTHTPVASTILRLACKNYKKIKVFYTAHGFHFYTGAPIANWLIYYPIEKWLSRYTDVLITINKEDYQRAKKLFKAGRVEYIPGVGLDTRKFANVTIDRFAKRKELGLSEDAFVLLSVGELNKNKNHEIVIKALARLNNSKIYYVICGAGPLHNHLNELSNKLGVGNQVKLLGFRSDIAEIYKAADLFVFPSLREGLPVSLMEAMASGLSVVCSNIRENRDLVKDGVGGYFVKPKDVDKFAQYIKDLFVCTENSKSMTEYNIEAVKFFDSKAVIKRMQEIYSDYGFMQ